MLLMSAALSSKGNLKFFYKGNPRGCASVIRKGNPKGCACVIWEGNPKDCPKPTHSHLHPPSLHINIKRFIYLVEFDTSTRLFRLALFNIRWGDNKWCYFIMSFFNYIIFLNWIYNRWRISYKFLRINENSRIFNVEFSNFCISRDIFWYIR